MIKKVLTLLLVLASFCATAAEKVIRISEYSDPNATYAIGMLKLALSYIDKPYRIEINTSSFTQARVNEEVRIGGQLDLAWLASDKEMEASLLPIRIPLFKGLLGHRIFIINKNNQAKFDRVQRSMSSKS